MENNQHNIQCVGFIMDGNRRWAKAHGFSTFEGHAKGHEALDALVRVVHACHIPHMVCYAFSTENWNRTKEEVGYLMGLFERVMDTFVHDIKKEHPMINLRVIGQISRLPQNIQEAITRAESKNVDLPELTLWIALSYGGRAEITDAVNRAVDRGEHVTEETFAQLLWTEGMPDPDIIIRTSGEVRTSNFLLWQSAYSEYFFIDTLWPDFGESEFRSIVGAYGERKRRKGV